MSSENVELVKSLQPSGMNLVERLAGAETAEAVLGDDVDPDLLAEELEDGTVVRIRYFLERDEALKAVGLRV
jgi:hypothetical protein